MLLGDQDRPVNEGIHEREDVNCSVEQAEVEALSRMGRLCGRGHDTQDLRLPAVIILLDVRIVQMGEGPRLQGIRAGQSMVL